MDKNAFYTRKLVMTYHKLTLFLVYYGVIPYLSKKVAAQRSRHLL